MGGSSFPPHQELVAGGCGIMHLTDTISAHSFCTTPVRSRVALPLFPDAHPNYRLLTSSQ